MAFGISFLPWPWLCSFLPAHLSPFPPLPSPPPPATPISLAALLSSVDKSRSGGDNGESLACFRNDLPCLGTPACVRVSVCARWARASWAWRNCPPVCLFRNASDSSPHPSSSLALSLLLSACRAPSPPAPPPPPEPPTPPPPRPPGNKI